MMCRAVALFGALVIAAAVPAQETTLNQIENAKRVLFEQGAQSALGEFQNIVTQCRNQRDRRCEAIGIGYVGFSYYNLGDFSKALECLQQALRLKRELRDRSEEGKTLGHIGLVYWATGRYDEASRTQTESLVISRQLGDKKMEGSALGNLGLVHDELGQFTQALHEYEEALHLHRETGFVRGESDVLGNIGGIHILLGRYAEALPYYQQALALDEKQNLKPSITLDLGNMGLCYTGLGQIPRALDMFDRALAAARSTGQKKEEADWHKGKGTALIRSGKFEAGIGEYRLATAVYERAGLPRELVESLQDLANVHLELGDIASAETDWQQALSKAQAMGHTRGVTASLLGLGDLESRRKRWEQAASHYGEALAQATRAGNRQHTIASLIGLSTIDREQGRTRDAMNHAREARTLAHTNRIPALESESLYALAEAERSGGELAANLRHLSLAGHIARTISDPGLIWKIEYAQGRSLEALHRDQDAIRAYKRSVTAIESVRNQLREDRFRTGYLQNKYDVYVALVRLLLQLGQVATAFDYAERLRAESYSALLVHSTPRAHSEEEHKFREQIRALRLALATEREKASSERRALRAEAFSSELIQAERKYQFLIDDLRAADPEYAASRTLRSPPAAEIQRRIDPGAALIEYLVANDRLLVFAVTRTRFDALSVPLGRLALRAKVELFRELMSRRSDEWQKPALSLRSSLIEPLERQGWLDGIATLYIVPDDVLHYLPFSALPTVGGNRPRYLIEDYVIQLLPSSVAIVCARPPELPRTLLAMAPASVRLPNAPDEVRSVGSYFPAESQVLVGRDATESSFKKNAGRYTFLHLATHGEFNRMNPLFSALQFEPNSTDDGRLEVHEILDLRLKASLVTLSACNTALGSTYFGDSAPGDEIVGLTRAFLYAGSRAVLAALWEVSDRASLDVMRLFYAGLADQQMAGALSHAQRSIATGGGRYSHPYYWAAFVLIGG